MVVRVATVAFEGIEARPVDVQVQIANANVVFTVVGLGDKAVAESRERVRAALNASGLAMPAKRVTVNLAPYFNNSMYYQIVSSTLRMTKTGWGNVWGNSVA
jgi:hypothetical protein